MAGGLSGGFEAAAITNLKLGNEKGQSMTGLKHSSNRFN